MELTEEQKIGTCEICDKENTIVEASGYHVAFVCLTCLGHDRGLMLLQDMISQP